MPPPARYACPTCLGTGEVCYVCGQSTNGGQPECDCSYCEPGGLCECVLSRLREDGRRRREWRAQNGALATAADYVSRYEEGDR